VEISKKRIDRKNMKTPAPNAQFHAMAAVAPQKRRFNFGGCSPARSSMEAATE